MLSGILVQFVLRCAFGLSAAMSITSDRLVTSGFFRVHLWVVMGLCTLAALVIGSQNDTALPPWTFWAVVGAAALSYVGSVIWMYERSRVGRVALVLVTVLAGAAALQLARTSGATSLLGKTDVLLSGLLLGLALASMLLGHWYLNTPTMKLEPLKLLLLGLMAVAALQGALGIAFIADVFRADATMPTSWWSVLAMRWLTGIVAALGLTYMAWQTLKIPNTQSATGILYVVVIVVFLGELSSHWLTAARHV